MDIYHDYRSFPAELKGGVVAIGNFDGVHKGHQNLLEDAGKRARAAGIPFCVMTFEPHPRKLFRPDDPPFRLTPAALKRERLALSGADALIELGFDWDFASQSAEDFVKHILIEGLGARHIVVGYDFRFGQLRKGDADTLRGFGLETTVLDKICDDGDSAFSSSRARQALRHGNLYEAREILGWDWEIRGNVVKGDQRGRALGFPTANMTLGDCVHPAYGVYAALVQIEGEGEAVWHKAATNIGIRPMFEVPVAQVETFIFDFNREIYGKTLRLRPVQRLRGEAKFHSLEELIVQMNKDCEQARLILNWSDKQ